MSALRYNLPMPAQQPGPKPVQSIQLDDVRHVAKLARLDLSPEQLDRFTLQLESILHYVAKIGEVDVSGTAPMAHAVPLANVLRSDDPQPALPLEQVLANAPDTDGPFFKVPKVIGGDEDSAG
jgi:aspartyl-tRNA(Asn)/glutamyl-tRNA(Gln) amidotransferase subunit C